MSIFPTPTINVCKNTNSEAEAQDFLEKFFEGTQNPMPDNQNKYPNSNAPKKKLSINEFESHLIKTNDDWKDWKYSIQILLGMVKGKDKKQVTIDAEINLIQAAVIKKDIEQVRCITSLAKQKGNDNLDHLLRSELKCQFPEEWEEWDLTQKCSWIKDATVIHLATYWHLESLVHFLELSSNLSDIKTTSYQTTPLHVASLIEDDAVATNLLIRKGFNVDAVDKKGQTALHHAAQSFSIEKVITLLFEGNADVIKKDYANQTPLHLAKTSEILNILLHKVDAEQVTELTGEDCLFQKIISKHEQSIATYLDLMVSCKNSISIDESHFIFQMDMFNNDTTKKANYLDKHKKLIEVECQEMLRHPVMMFFTYLKWCPHRKWYFINLFLFMAFLVCLSLHAIFCISFLQCDDTDEYKKQTNCKEEKTDLKFRVTQYLSWCFLGSLIVWEIWQMICKYLTDDLKGYFFRTQNVTELLMLSISLAFFVIEENEDESWQEHLLGWALFLGWFCLTIFLGRFDIFGRHIYRSWHVMKNVFWSMVVYIPVLFAFAGAFHCFLRNNETFKGIGTSVLKSLAMVLGEIDLEDNFVASKVKKDHGSNGSVQMLLVFLIIYGSLIIMNLITAWIVDCQQIKTETEVILAEQRIEEISGMTTISGLLKRLQKTSHPNGELVKNRVKNNLLYASYLCVGFFTMLFILDHSNVPAKLCISSMNTTSLDKSDDLLSHMLPNYWKVQIWNAKLRSWLNDEPKTRQKFWDSKVWILQEHSQNGPCKEIRPDLPLYTYSLGTIANLTFQMLEARKMKKSALNATIKMVQKATDKKVKELISNEEKNAGKEWLIPEGHTHIGHRGMHWYTF